MVDTLEKIVEGIINYFKNLDLCKFGIHEWRVLESQSKYSIWLEVASNRRFSKEPSVLVTMNNRVCLRCKKVDLSIDEYKDAIRKEVKENEKLHEYAKQIVKESKQK